MAAKKKNGAVAIDARLTQLRNDFAALQDDIKGLAGDVGTVASDRAHLAMRSAEDVADPSRVVVELLPLRAERVGGRVVVLDHDLVDRAADRVPDTRRRPVACGLLSVQLLYEVMEQPLGAEAQHEAQLMPVHR